MGFFEILSPLKKFETLPIDQIPTDVIETFNKTMRGHESGGRYGLVNKDPGTTEGFSLGTAQWRGNRAVNILEQLKNKNPELAEQYVGNVDIRDQQQIWKNRDKVAEWIGTPEGQQVQQQQMRVDFKNTINFLKKNNVQSAGAAIALVDLSHRYGLGGVKKRFINPSGPTTLSYIAHKLDSLQGKDDFNYKINVKRLSGYGKAFGGEAGAVLSMYDAADAVINKGMDVDSVYNELASNAPAVDMSEIIDDKISPTTGNTEENQGTGIDTSKMVSDTSLFKDHLNLLIKDVFKTNPEKRDPVDILFEAVLKGLLKELLT